ncbi:uncharacterized protein [Drosophila tropicalis]|uniref:uncharacterized protein n=1 Tax=Drosophila tropicalis TaxID=46794 RepID=UPI0035ABED22
MSSVHVLELPDDCLYYIFDYLEAEDRLKFAQVCHRFKQVFVAQLRKKYCDYSLELKCQRLELLEFSMCREIVERLSINLAYFEVNEVVSVDSSLKLFHIVCGSLLDMENLRYLIVHDTSGRVQTFAKPFEQILMAVKHLSQLKGLEIHAIGECSLENLSQLNHLEELQLHLPQIEASTLSKCCQSNSNLRVLYLQYNCVRKNLKQIVPHCKNLEVLTFGMAAEASDYRPLANLPKLRELTHSGIRKSGSFQPLLRALANKSQLERLVISGVSLNMQEAEEIVRIDSLVKLKCFCSSIQCVEMLAKVSKLEELCLWMSTSEDITHALLKIVINCTNLKLLFLAGGMFKEILLAKCKN